MCRMVDFQINVLPLTAEFLLEMQGGCLWGSRAVGSRENELVYFVFLCMQALDFANSFWVLPAF